MKSILLFFGAALFIAAVVWIGSQEKATPVNAHYHGELEVSEINKPDISIKVNKDPMGGWNLQFMTQRFRFSPKNVNSVHIEGEGHGHLYINDTKVTRIYGEWFYLNPLPPGKHTLRVSLNTNDHKTLLFEGEPIEAISNIIQPK
ncbi:hypothetical protein N9J26_01325 [bacterium]|nr:hypothetical protein [bacterium]